MRILFIIPLMILCFTPVANAKKPKDVMKVRKIRKTLKKIYNLDKLPSDDEVYSISENWRPYRSVAVRYIWEIVDQDINF